MMEDFDHKEEEEVMPNQEMSIEHLHEMDAEELVADYAQWSDKSNNEMPDGLMDASGYVDAIHDIIDVINHCGDLEDSMSRSALMLRLSKAAASADGLIAIAHIFTVVLSNLDEIREGALDALKHHLDHDVREAMEDYRSVPYWNND